MRVFYFAHVRASTSPYELVDSLITYVCDEQPAS